MYDNIKNKVVRIISLVSQKTGAVGACLLFIKNTSFRQAIIFTALLSLVVGTIPFIAPTPAHAILAQPGNETDCTKAGGKWTYITGGGGANPFVCNIATVKLMTPQEEAASYDYYAGLKRCVANTDGAAGPGMKPTIKSSAGQDGNVGPSGWFDNDGSSNVIIYPYAQVSCVDAMSKALSLWGYGNDYKGFLIAIGYQYNTSTAQWSGPSDGTMRWNQFAAAIQSKVYGGTAPTLSSAAIYANSIDGFLSSRCRATDLGIYNDITNNTYRDYINSNHSEPASNDAVKDIIPNAQGNINFAKVTIINPANKPEEHGYAYQSNGGNALACAGFPAVITNNAPGWITWMQEHQGRTDVAPPPTKDGTVGGDTGGASTCSVEGVGWIVCPVMKLMANVVDAAYGFVSSLLVVQPLMTTGDTAGVYSAWSVMRTFANVAFVIAFIIIIYSQLTGAGINNYGIKKMLPRLIVAAILVNVSYWVCAIAVDLSNILGSSVNGLLHNAIPLVDHANESAIGKDVKTGNNVLGWVGITGVVLASTVAILYIGLSALIPALIAALLAIVTVFLVLTLRQALIILLVIISPLAFVAYLLPNTEGWFKKWRELFQTLLLMFPIIAFLFGASALASTIVMNGASGNYKIAIQIMGALIAIIPLALTPIVMKTAGGVLNKFGGMVNNPNKGPFDRMKKGAENIRNRQQDRRAIRAMNNGTVFGRGQFRRQAKREAIDASLKRERANQSQQFVASEAMKTETDPITGDEKTVATGFGRKLAGAGPLGGGADVTAIQSALANAQFTIDEAIAKEIKAESVMVRDMDKSQLKRIVADVPDNKASDAQKAAAMQRLVRVADPIDYEAEINSAINSKSSVLRRATAEALGTDGPGFVKASDVDRIASGAMKKENEANRAAGREETSLATIARDNTAAGVMSAEKIVNETNGSIQYAFDNSEDGPNGGKMRLYKASVEAQGNDQLKGKIKHNVAAISALTTAAKHVARPTPVVYTKTDSSGVVTTTVNSTKLDIS